MDRRSDGNVIEHVKLLNQFDVANQDMLLHALSLQIFD